MPWFSVAIAAFLLLAGCEPARPDASASTPNITLEPSAPLDIAPAVVRLHVTGLNTDPASLSLWSGELTSYAAEKIRDGLVPSPMSSRQVPALSWASGSGEIVVAPLSVLEPGTVVSVTAFGKGLVGAFRVIESSPARLVTRVFPPPDTGARRWVFCGSHDILTDTPVVLDPTGALVAMAPGADSAGTAADKCLHLDAEELPLGLGQSLPPLGVGGTSFAPLPGTFDPAVETTKPLSCSSTEIALGPGCATVGDDRLVMRSPLEPTVWALEIGDESVVAATRGGEPLVVKGLVPGRDNRVNGSATDVTGRETPIDIVVSTSAPRPHVVINEVLANPLGPEPDQEWVEIVNDGSAAVDLLGFRLGDAGSDLQLPPATLTPGQFALVVMDTFDARSSLDVPPAPGTLLLRLSRLSQSGISNAGEALSILTPDGSIVSEFPAVAALKAGVSVARAHPWDLDEDRSAFAVSAAPGASPGAENTLAK